MKLFIERLIQKLFRLALKVLMWPFFLVAQFITDLFKTRDNAILKWCIGLTIISWVLLPWYLSDPSRSEVYIGRSIIFFICVLAMLFAPHKKDYKAPKNTFDDKFNGPLDD